MDVKFEFQSFMARNRLKQRELAEKMGVSIGLVGMWSSGRSIPGFEKMGKLIELGMTAQELFGKEIGDLLVKNSSNPESDRGEIMAAVKAALADLGGR